ncbi:MAG: metal ABC transporter permease [Kiritimatiellae bacterium]|nr:metal ABC transporter permease [Kiritimatiellia bacterium]
MNLRPFICLMAVACVTALLWLHGPALAQEEGMDIDALRKAALSEILSENVIAKETDEVVGEKQEYQADGRFNFFAMQICLIAVVLILHTYTGMHIIKRGIIFCDLVLDQLAALGIVAGIALGVKYGTPCSYLMAMSATLVGCVLLALIRPKNKLVPYEAVIGIMYGMALVVSLLLADKLPTGGADLKNALMGSMSWVSWSLVGVTVCVYMLLLVFHYLFRRRMINITSLDGNVSAVGSLSVSQSDTDVCSHRILWDFLFFLSQGLITILIVPVAGVLLAYGFLMIPAAIGLLLTRTWRAGLIVGWLSGMLACLAGLFFSYKTDSPYGPSLLLSMGILFFASLFIRGLFQSLKGGAV